MNRRQFAIVGMLICLGAVMGVRLLGDYAICVGYGDWQVSPYVLPFEVGTSHEVYQGNCSFGGHHGGYLYSYDFLMPIGTPVTAVRDGVVVEVLDGFENGNNGIENWVKVQHSDGTYAAYSHLHSIAVEVGQAVGAGEVLGLSGNTGQTGGVPHLHFHVSACSEPVDCGTLPVTFRNTAANPNGLKAGETYEALAVVP